MIRAVFLVLLAAPAFASVTGFIDKSTQERFVSILNEALARPEVDAEVVHYAAKGLGLLKRPPPAKTACSRLEAVLKPDSPIEVIYYAISGWTALGCPKEVPKNVVSVLEEQVNKDTTKLDALYYATEALTLLKQTLKTPQKIADRIKASVKKEDSLMNMGYAIKIALTLGSTGKSIAETTAEDVLVQADEVDGKMLQFEGGLFPTSFLLTSIIRLDLLQQEQADKFAAYLLTRSTVNNPRSIYALVDVVELLRNSKVSPVVITLAGPSSVKQEKPEISFRVCDLLGVAPKPAPTSVIAQSVRRLNDDAVVLSKKPLVSGADPTLYKLDLQQPAGRYGVTIVADKQSQVVTVTVLGLVSVDYLEAGLTDPDQITTTDVQKLKFEQKMSKALEMDSQQRLLVKFSLGTSRVQQAFVRLYSTAAAKREVIFVAEKDSTNAYRLVKDLGGKGGELSGYPGTYEMELIIGDSAISNPIRWHFGSLKLKGSPDEEAAAAPVKKNVPKPEIRHLFREAERRPPQVVSLLFTALCIAPLFLLLVLWARLKVRIAFPFKPSALLFHAGLGAIFTLFGIFWLKLNMFTTSWWLLLIGSITFLSGHRLLRSLAGNKKKKDS